MVKTVRYNKEEILKVANKYNFQRDIFEKSLRIKDIIDFFQIDNVLQNHFLLKGGTAINLVFLDLPRLSVDIDMDYYPNDDKNTMISNRETITERIKESMLEQGYQLSNIRHSHSLDSFVFRYKNAGGNNDVLKIELNYSLRAHVLQPSRLPIISDAFGTKTLIYTVNPVEVNASKINALLNRIASRDLYDVYNFTKFNHDKIDKNLLRKTALFYGAISSKNNNYLDLNSIDKISFKKIRSELFPTLAIRETRKTFDLEVVKHEVKTFLKELLNHTVSEKEFLEKFKMGIYEPELLFEDLEIINRIKEHPMAIYRCNRNNV